MNSEEHAASTEKVSEKEGLESALVDEEDLSASDSEGSDSFDHQLEQTLKETAEAVLSLSDVHGDSDVSKLWMVAGKVVRDFRPVPWFIWRLSNFVLGRSGQIGQISEGLVFGMRRLLFAVGSDPVLGAGEKVKTVRMALKTVPGDVIAASSVIHSICRRLANKEHERIWKPILDDALLRAQIGFSLGKHSASFGGGRGMLAGFSGRAGLTVLIATGELDEARKALELLATGKSIRETGFLVYQSDPLQVSAMLLTASGIGRDAAFGTASFSLDPINPPESGAAQAEWYTAFQIIEYVRLNEPEKIPESSWQLFDCGEEERSEIFALAQKTIRRGHGWQWIMG